MACDGGSWRKIWRYLSSWIPRSILWLVEWDTKFCETQCNVNFENPFEFPKIFESLKWKFLINPQKVSNADFYSRLIRMKSRADSISFLLNSLKFPFHFFSFHIFSTFQKIVSQHFVSQNFGSKLGILLKFISQVFVWRRLGSFSLLGVVCKGPTSFYLQFFWNQKYISKPS